MYPDIGIAVFMSGEKKDGDQKQQRQEQVFFGIFSCVCANIRGGITLDFETLKEISRHMP
jgi:hypothetical protein